jgi:hypothetical protein
MHSCAVHLRFLLLAVPMMATIISCRKNDDHAIEAEFYLINNTSHSFVLHCLTENLEKDTIFRVPSDTKFCLSDVMGVRDYHELKPFIDQRLIRITDENNVDWLPRISDPEKWGNIRLPAKNGTRQLFFVLMNPLDDGMNRLQNLGIIRLFRILQALSFLIVLSSILGLFYVRLRYKAVYILLALLLNYPVIYYTADFGYFIRNSLDPFFIFPKWVVESTRYFVRFSIPLGAMIVWLLLIGRRIIMTKKK